MLAPTCLDRRLSERSPSAMHVFVSPFAQHDGYFTCRALNISLLGIAIEPPAYYLSEGQLINLCFVAHLGTCSEKTTIEALVVHANERSVGIKFESVGRNVLSVLRPLLSEAKQQL